MTMTNHASHFQEARGPTLMQINVEGLTKAKREVIQHLAQKHRAVGILLQETHSTKDEQLQIPGFIAAIHHPKHGIATLCSIGCTDNAQRLGIKPRSHTGMTIASQTLSALAVGKRKRTLISPSPR